MKALKLGLLLALVSCTGTARDPAPDAGVAAQPLGPSVEVVARRPPVAPRGFVVPRPIVAESSERFVLRRSDSLTRFGRDGFTVTVASGRGKDARGWGLAATFDGGRPVTPRAGQPLGGRANVLVGKPSEWKVGLPAYGQLVWPSVWPGVDAEVQARPGGFEYRFVLAPGAHVEDVALRWQGQTKLESSQGTLSLATELGTLRLSDLHAWELRGGTRVERPVRHTVRADGRVGFEVDGWDGHAPLIIDPTVGWSSFHGGSNYEDAIGVGVDSTGAAIVAGGTMSSDLPTTTGALSGTLGSFYDGWVAKVSASGTLVWSTYLGGNSADEVRSMAVDKTDAVVLTGITTSSTFPLKNAIDTTLGGFVDAFVTKLDGSGALVFSTYLGGSDAEDQPGRGIAVDASNDIVVVGGTSSSDFPLKDAFDGTYAGGSCSEGPCTDAFVTKLSASGTLIYSSYLGGAKDDSAAAVSIDASGAAFVVGKTDSSDFDKTGGFDTALGGTTDAFVTKVSSSGARVWSSFLGGVGLDEANGVAVDGSGAAYVVGATASSDLVTTSPFDATYGGAQDGFLAKINGGGTVAWSTYLGESGADAAKGVSVDPTGAVLVVGQTGSIAFPMLHPFSPALGGPTDGFVSKLSASGNLIWSSFLGGSNADTANAIAAPAAVWIAGTTQSSDFPSTGGFDTSLGGTHDAFVLTLVAPGANGAACTDAWDCASNQCFDGVCCDRACGGPCEACSASKKGAGTSGTCGAIKDGTDPDAECAAASCSGTSVNKASVCNGSGACRTNGTTSCGDYQCKAGACPTSCATSADCSATTYCKATACAALEPKGTACSDGRQCASGFCADGVCCDKACGGACEACTTAKKGSGADGTCEPVAADTDPKDACPRDSLYPNNCKADGLCDGKGACRAVAKEGTACGATTCASSTLTGRLCDASGTCQTSATSCAPYASCADGASCLSSCASEASCASTHFCGATSTCVAKKKNGQSCSATKECESGFCVDGVCCDTACSGQCEACNEGTDAGKCVAVTGSPKHGACAGDPAVCGGRCDGIDRAACTYEPATKPCGSTCSEGKETRSTCDGKGACSTGTATDCAPYRCGETACKTACATESDCSSGYACKADACVPKGTTCSDDGLSVIDASGASSLCGGGATRCRGGKCVEICSTTDDCAPGYLCSSGACSKAANAETSDEGGCAYTPRGARGASAVLALLVTIGFVGRRRRGPSRCTGRDDSR